MPAAQGALDRVAAGALLFALWLGAGLAPLATAPTRLAVQDDGGDSADNDADADADDGADADGDDGADDDGLGPLPLYAELREARVAHAGQIRDGRMRLDRFEFELTDGHLYLAPEIGGVISTAVFLGDGLVRAYPPDALEYHQLEKLSDEHHLEAEFDRLLLRFTDDTADRLKALATPAPDRDTGKANDLLEDRRGDRLEQLLDNPDSRVLEDLVRRQAGALAAERTYALIDIDSKDHGWLILEIEPNEVEEVVLSRYERRRRAVDTWMSFDILSDYERVHRDAVLDGFAVDPDSLDGEVTGVALGLPPRPIEPDREGWAVRARVPRAQIDLALEGDGDTRGTAALLIEPLEPTRGLRLRISPVLEVTDVRWRPDTTAGSSDDALLAPPSSGGTTTNTEPDEPAALIGERVYFVQERHDRFLNDDLFERWVTVALPRTVAADERFVLELAYEGELVERLRQSLDFVLKDTMFWRPQHPDGGASRLDLTFRVPERYRVASGGTLTEERVDDDTRIMRWVTTEPVRAMAFNYGRFDVTEVEGDAPPAMSVYSNNNHLGFAPGNREKTVADLTDSIRLYADYFGPFPFASLLATETPASGGQAFPGFLLLSYQAFGELHTGEAELFRAHEVAHQWWGVAVDWEDYRDQWMSEGFANYAAALYALHGLEKPDQFLEMLDSWRLDVLGEGHVGQGIGLRHYGFRPEVLRRSDGHDSGALTVGYRLNSAETPFDYRILVYEKGAYVLHMLRSMLLDPETGGDERFRELMRTYAADHLREPMSTGSFEAAVERAFGEPMDWFFDQWVYGVEVPTYRPDLVVSPLIDSRSPFVLHGRIRQDDVSDGFKMPVPVRLTFDDRPPMTHRVWVDAAEVMVELPLPARPTRVEFNYQHAVLAKVR